MTNQSALEEGVSDWLAKFARLVSWEPVESILAFVEALTPCIVNKMKAELPEAMRRNRIEALGKRAYRWLERSFWEDIREFPDAPLDMRTARLKRSFDTAPSVPFRRGDSEHFPPSVFIEYDALLKLLEPVFLRRPAEVSHLTGRPAKRFASGTSQGERGMGRYRSTVLDAVNAQRIENWKKELLQQADCVIPVEFWTEKQQVFFQEEELLQLTPRSAALKILGAKLGIGNYAVEKLIKEGKKMLPPKVLEKMEEIWAAANNNDSWQVLNQCYPHK